MAFTKSEMYYKDYSWNAKQEHDNPKITGEPDSTLLDRNEGYEVLYFVNACARKWNWQNPGTSDYQKIEKMIREVPTSIRSQAGIKQWIENNWKKY